MPSNTFDTALLLQVRVDNRARISVRQTFYSVPARYVSRRVWVRLSAAAVEVVDGAKVVARHDRAFGRGGEVLTLDHYLEVLKVKPGALPGATALAQARAAGAFTSAHQRYWDAARAHYGDKAGTRAMVEILLAHRTLGAGELIAAMKAAVDTGCLDTAAVLIDARRAGAPPTAPVVPIGALTRYDRPAPDLADYDTLLTGSD